MISLNHFGFHIGLWRTQLCRGVMAKSSMKPAPEENDWCLTQKNCIDVNGTVLEWSILQSCVVVALLLTYNIYIGTVDPVDPVEVLNGLNVE